MISHEDLVSQRWGNIEKSYGIYDKVHHLLRYSNVFFCRHQDPALRRHRFFAGSKRYWKLPDASIKLGNDRTTVYFPLKKNAAQSDFSFRRYASSKVHHRGNFFQIWLKKAGLGTVLGPFEKDFGPV